MKQKKYFSLQLNLSLLIVFCWIMPIALLYWFTSSWFGNNLAEKIESTLEVEISNSAEYIAGKLQDSAGKAIRASQDSAIAQAYQIYLEDGNTNASWSMAHQYLKNNYEVDPNLRASFLFWTDNPEISFYCGNELALEENYKNELQAEALELSKEIGTAPYFLIKGDRIFILRNMRSRVNDHPFAILMLELKTEQVFKSLLVNEAWDGRILFSINGAWGGLQMENPAPDRLFDQLRLQENYTISQDKETLFYYKYRTEHLTFAYRTAALNDEIYSEYNTAKQLMVAMLAVILPILFFVIYYLYRTISRPVDRLTRGLGEIEQGKFGVELKSTAAGSREFDYVFKSFNNMSKQMKHLFDRVYLEQLASRDAKIMALQSQINPHFLNNTLEAMNWEARMSGDQKVSMMIEALSTLMDANTARDEKPLVPLREELGYVQAYIFIARQRFGDRLEVEINVDEKLMETEIPRLILQPILENAVEHGVEPAGQGHLWLEIYREGQTMRIDVINDGRELTKENQEKIENLLRQNEENSFERLGITRVGIRNVHERLQLIYGSHGMLSISRGDHGKTIARITIPIGEAGQIKPEDVKNSGGNE